MHKNLNLENQIGSTQVQQQYRPTTLSLFSGAGGLDIGFHKAGFKMVACVEKEGSFCQTLYKNLGKYLESDCRVINEDIRILEPEQIFNDQIDFIIGGPPCQTFSAIGRRAGGVYGIMDERGSLFEHYCRLVKHYQPKGFLFENVRGILGASQGRDWKVINEKFSDLGYQIHYRILDCADYGVPQHRERLILVGTKTHNFKFLVPTHGMDSPNRQPHVTAFEAIANLQDPLEVVHTYTGKYGHLLAEVPPGMNYHYFTREMGYPNPIFAWRSRFSDFLYKADPDKPVRTIVAQLGAYSGPFHWKNRKFTIQEFKRLQTFPDDYELVGSFNTVLKQIGNSVPPVFAEKLAEAVFQQIFGIDLGLKLLEEDEKLSFDLRKSRKAKSTRSNRLNKTSDTVQLNLFTSNENILASQNTDSFSREHSVSEKFFHYSSVKQRNTLKKLFFPISGVIYRFITKRFDQNCLISVSRYEDEKFIETPLLSYKVRFQHPIGNGVELIECILLSNEEKDIPIAWDAIEDCLRQCSGYQTMMDVYGHFTEPHPIFNLQIEIFTEKPSFLLKFAKKFSNFHSTKNLYPGQVLQDLYGEKSAFDLTEVVKTLRNLRFDVRVNETNRTIPPGYFRCCYPFTLNIDKQISVAWENHP